MRSFVLGCLLLLASLLSHSPVQADDNSARAALTQAQHLINSATKEDLEEAFTSLLSAIEQADSASLRNSIQNMLSKVDNAYDAKIRRHMPTFLDVPVEGKVDFYQQRAKLGHAQALRQYGEFLLEEGMYNGWDYVEKAAEKNEPRALFLMAERYRYARGGVSQDGSAAYHYLLRSAQQNYAPAHELLAKGYWDGDDTLGCQWNQNSAIVHLNAAIKLYSAWELYDASEHRLLQDVIACLRQALIHMSNIHSGKVTLSKFFYPSFDALRMMSLRSDSEDALRARLYYICWEMERFGTTYHTSHFLNTRLEYVPITIERCPQKEWMGLCSYEYDGSGFYSYNIKIDVTQLPPSAHSGDTISAWYGKNFMREIALTNILAHELAHGLFHSYYPKLAKFSDEDSWLTYEGHATHSAYAVVRSMYYGNQEQNLSYDSYAADFCQGEYKRAFFWFLNNCISPQGRVFWHKLDRWERNAGSEGYEHRHLIQDPNKYEAWKPSYFGRAFYGYM